MQSRGPNPFVNFSQAQQAEYLNEGEYMAFRRTPGSGPSRSSCSSTTPPTPQDPVGSKAYWATFQSGLLFYPLNTQPKPAYYAFELPIWLPNATHGSTSTVWAQIRPAPRHRARCSSRPAARDVDQRGAGRADRLRGLREHHGQPALGGIAAAELDAPGRAPVSPVYGRDA